MKPEAMPFPKTIDVHRLKNEEDKYRNLWIMTRVWMLGSRNIEGYVKYYIKTNTEPSITVVDSIVSYEAAVQIVGSHNYSLPEDVVCEWIPENVFEPNV